MKTHKLKIWPRWFNGVINGTKTFEVRRLDRDYLTGDYLLLQEFNQTKLEYTGRECLVVITTILTVSDFMREGYGVLGIRLVRDQAFHERLELLKQDLWLANEDGAIKQQVTDLIETCQRMDNLIQTDRFFRKHICDTLERFMIGFDPRYKYELDKIIQKFAAKESTDVNY